MFEQKELFWKNFRLGTELQVAGGFIYDALYLSSDEDCEEYEDTNNCDLDEFDI